MGEGTIATVRYRSEPETVFRSTNEGKFNDFPIVVLINGESTGGADDRGGITGPSSRGFGRRASRGKGNVQRIAVSARSASR